MQRRAAFLLIKLAAVTDFATDFFVLRNKRQISALLISIHDPFLLP
jgi:hypothetical protein